MSGIYIPGLRVPGENEDELWFAVRSDGTVTFNAEWGWTMNEGKAVLVPEHGRMIDADAFCEKILEIVERQKYDDFYAESLSVGAILREVVNELNGSGLAGFSNAPTIIPADKEGEGYDK